MSQSTSWIGRSLQGIRVLELIGRGGMGEVYRGWDERLQRAVALKRIRPELELDSDTKVRFLHEARVLGRLDHPGICRIHDILETDEGDVLVLELVDGRTLRHAVVDLDRGERLALAEQLVEVLEAAHALGVVHRDLKPDNLMVQESGELKVLDFGLSRSLDEEEATRTWLQAMAATAGGVEDETRTMVFDLGPGVGSETALVRTEHGAVVGTVRYMSPEQARGENATTASDLFSLGLVLQELFTGERAYPVELKGDPLLVEVAAGRSRPARTGDAELDELIERLKAEAPAERPAAVDVAERLRWIRERPKRRRRRRLRIAAVALLAVIAVATTVLAVIATRRAEEARRARATAEKVTEFLVGLFEEADPGRARGSDPTARELLAAGSRRIEDRLRGEPEVRAQVLGVLGRVQRRLGYAEEAAGLLEQALGERERLHGPESLEVADVLAELAGLSADQGESEEGLRLARRALAIRERELGPRHPAIAEVLQPIGNVLRERDELEEAQAVLERAVSILEEGEPTTRLSASLANLGSVHMMAGRHDRAEELYRRTLAIDRELLGEDHWEVATDLHLLSYVLGYQERFAEAETLSREALAIRRKVLAPGHLHIAENLGVLAQILLDLDRAEEVPPLIEEAVEIERAGATGVGELGWLLRIRAYAEIELRAWEELESTLGEIGELVAEHGEEGSAAGFLERLGGALEEAAPPDGVSERLQGLLEKVIETARSGAAREAEGARAMPSTPSAPSAG